MFKNRKRRNEDAKDFLHGKQHNMEVLTGAFERRNELMMVSDADKQRRKSDIVLQLINTCN